MLGRKAIEYSYTAGGLRAHGDPRAFSGFALPGVGGEASGAIFVVMNALKAHVRNGQIVLDAPAELAEGAELLVLPVTDEMSAEERAELERAVEEGAEDFARGDYEDAHDFAARLAAKP